MTGTEQKGTLATQLKECAQGMYPRPTLENILNLTAEQINLHTNRAHVSAAELGIELRHGSQNPHLGGNSLYFKPETNLEAMDSYQMPYSAEVLTIGQPAINNLQVVLHSPIPIPLAAVGDLKEAFATQWDVPTLVFGGIHNAARDALTGVANRNGLEYFLEYHAFNNGSSQRTQPAVAALLAMDIDEFDEVNNKYGHTTGDRVLKFVAAAAEQAIQTEIPDERNWIVGRSGGDEFEAIIRYTSIEQMERIVSNLDRALGGPVASNHRKEARNTSYILEPTPGLSVSAGYSIFSTEGWRPSEFHLHVDRIKDEADKHMYRRKRLKQQTALDHTLDAAFGST